jgi:hypothetical protein
MEATGKERTATGKSVRCTSWASWRCRRTAVIGVSLSAAPARNIGSGPSDRTARVAERESRWFIHAFRCIFSDSVFRTFGVTVAKKARAVACVIVGGSVCPRKRTRWRRMRGFGGIQTGYYLEHPHARVPMAPP